VVRLWFGVEGEDEEEVAGEMQVDAWVRMEGADVIQMVGLSAMYGSG
jgi:hypothetical protein